MTSPSAEPHLAGVARAGLAAAGDIVVIGNGLGADEAVLEITVNDAGGLRRLGAARHRPGARLLRPGGEERHQVEKRIAGADQAIEPGLPEADSGEIIVALLARRPARLVTVALANKAARVIWAIMVRGGVYRMPAGASVTTSV